MIRHRLAVALAMLALVLTGTTLVSAGPQEEGAAPAVPQDMMERLQKYTTIKPQHEALKRFLGEWKTELRFTMPGMPAKGEAGTSAGSWLMDGRWLQLLGKGSMMGRPFENYLLLGYDPLKQSYVMTMVSSMDNMMLRAEGDMTPDGKSLILYGEMDEYLTGEHDKMVKYAFRFPSKNEVLLEVYDLPIGEENAKVFEVRYTR